MQSAFDLVWSYFNEVSDATGSDTCGGVAELSERKVVHRGSKIPRLHQPLEPDRVPVLAVIRRCHIGAVVQTQSCLRAAKLNIKARCNRDRMPT